MKHHLSIYCCILFLTMGMAASCNSYKKKAPTQPQQAQEQPVQAAPASRLLTDSLLPQSVDLEQDINGLGYEELRILRSYPYALHGYWFIEGDLNNFFCRKTSFMRTHTTKSNSCLKKKLSWKRSTAAWPNSPDTNTKQGTDTNCSTPSFVSTFSK